MRCRVAIFALLAVAGCGDDSGLTSGNTVDMVTEGPTDLAGPAGDFAVTPPDLAIPPDLAGIVTIIGTDCPLGNECGMGVTCLSSKLSAALPEGGFCTKQCIKDDDCGPGAFCGPSLPGLGPICYADCASNGGCMAANRVCSRRFAGFGDLVKSACLPGNRNARDGAPCKTFGDCNRNQACLNNPFDQPGGYCVTFGCTLGDNTTCSPAPGNAGLCIVPVQQGLNACLPACGSVSDCRGAENYGCNAILPMGQGPTVCNFQHAPPGAACVNDKGCGADNTPWKCLTSAKFPKGYCSGPLGGCDVAHSADTCPNGAHCYDPTPKAVGSGDEFCTADCKMESDCRVGDGYHCLLDAATNTNGCRVN